jgi:predicted nucleotidyltransferase component of viral defense system
VAVDKRLRDIQLKVLEVFSRRAGGFALAGGTALELYYLRHRFSADLDFFSPKFDLAGIERLISGLKESAGFKVSLESEFTAAGKAKVRFYSVSAPGHKRPLKVDFVEDVLFDRPKIKNIKGVPVYGVESIYEQKIAAITGTLVIEDDIGRQFSRGRFEARDAFDLYVLSKKIKPLHIFLEKMLGQYQRGIVHWYRSFSRQDLKLGLLDLDIYDKQFDSRGMIRYLEDEIKEFVGGVLR